MRVEVEKLITEIKLYLSLYPVKEDEPSAPVISSTGGSNVHHAVPAMFASESFGQNNNDLICQILNQCDDATQDKLISRFGEQSQIAQIIRQKRSEQEKAASRLKMSGNMVSRNIEQVIKSMSRSENPFYDAIRSHIERLGFEKESDFYNSIQMPRQQFARLRDAGNQLSKKTVLWIIVGLHLDYTNANELLHLAGYSFRKSDTRDVILTYIFRNAIYDLDSVNEILVHFNLEPLC